LRLRRDDVAALRPTFRKLRFQMIAGHTSTGKMWSNQLRLYFSSITYVLLQTLRRTALAGTELEKGAMWDHPAEVAQDWRAGSSDRTEGLDLTVRKLSAWRTFH